MDNITINWNRYNADIIKKALRELDKIRPYLFSEVEDQKAFFEAMEKLVKLERKHKNFTVGMQNEEKEKSST